MTKEEAASAKLQAERDLAAETAAARTKTIVWGVVICTGILSATGIAIFGDDSARAWVEKAIIPFIVGMLVPGSPLGALFSKKASTPPV